MDKRKYVRYVTKEKLEKVNPENKHLVKSFIDSKYNLSDDSKAGYISDLNQFMVYVMENYHNEFLLDMDNEDAVDLLEDFVAFCRTFLGNNERRVQRRLSSISSLFLFLKKRRKYRTLENAVHSERSSYRIKENPLDYIERPSVKAGQKPQITQTYLTKEQVAEIRKGLRKLGDLQLTLFFEFGLSTMARVKTIASVRLDQINFKEGVIENVDLKGGYVDNLYPEQEVFDLIKKWLDYRDKEGIKSEYLFITKYGGTWRQASKNTMQTVWIKKIGNIIGIPEFHAHDLRHSAATLRKNAGQDIEEISELLHHHSLDVTKKHYIKVNADAIKKNKAKYKI